jgi:hypothetical protein
LEVGRNTGNTGGASGDGVSGNDGEDEGWIFVIRRKAITPSAG